MIIPANNKGRKSIALVYWLLAREVLKAKELISKDEQFERKLEEFEYKLSESENPLEEEGEEKRSRFYRGRTGGKFERGINRPFNRQGSRSGPRRGK